MNGLRWSALLAVGVCALSIRAVAAPAPDAVTTEEVLARIAKSEAEVKSFESDSRTVPDAGAKEREFRSEERRGG